MQNGSENLELTEAEHDVRQLEQHVADQADPNQSSAGGKP